MSKIQSLQIAAARMPVLSMPAQMSVGKHGVGVFTIETAAGPIKVEAWSKIFFCRGSADAFIAYGLLQPAWLPGAPGNNKTRQRVRFGARGPELIHGARRTRKCEMEAFLTITRLSLTTYQVTLPATPEQEDVLGRFREQQEAVRKAEEQRVREDRERIKRHQIPAHEVRAEVRQVAEAAANLMICRIEASAFRFDPATERQMHEHYRQIAQLIEGATLIPEGPLPQGGNVVRLRRT